MTRPQILSLGWLLVIISGHERVAIPQQSREACEAALTVAYEKRPPIEVSHVWSAHCEQK